MTSTYEQRWASVEGQLLSSPVKGGGGVGAVVLAHQSVAPLLGMGDITSTTRPWLVSWLVG